MNAISKPTKSRLKAVPPKAAEPSKPKVLIYGKPGVGKTWGALDFPACYYIDTEGGANMRHYTDKLVASGGMYLGPDQGSTDFATVLDQIAALAVERHNFRTLVIDSVSHLFNTEIAATQDRMAEQGKKDEYGASKKPALTLMRRAVMWLDKIDMNVILIAHQKDEYGTNQKGEREVIGATFDCWDKLEYILHLALHIEKNGPRRSARVRKSRLLGFPDAETFPWSYTEFASRYGRDIIEGDVKQIVVASDEQVAEFTGLLTKVRMPEDWLEKCLRRGKAERVEDLEATALAAMIEMVRKRMTEDAA